MKIIQYLSAIGQVGQEAGTAVADLEPVVEKVFDEAGELAAKIPGAVGTAAQKLVSDAESLFDQARTKLTGAASQFTSTTPATAASVAANLVGDVTQLFVEAKQTLGGDITALEAAGDAAFANFKLLVGQLAGGNDVAGTAAAAA